MLLLLVTLLLDIPRKSTRHVGLPRGFYVHLCISFSLVKYFCHGYVAQETLFSFSLRLPLVFSSLHWLCVLITFRLSLAGSIHENLSKCSNIFELWSLSHRPPSYFVDWQKSRFLDLHIPREVTQGSVLYSCLSTQSVINALCIFCLGPCLGFQVFLLLLGVLFSI